MVAAHRLFEARIAIPTAAAAAAAAAAIREVK